MGAIESAGRSLEDFSDGAAEGRGKKSEYFFLDSKAHFKGFSSMLTLKSRICRIGNQICEHRIIPFISDQNPTFSSRNSVPWNE